MAQITIGTVTVTNGSATVTGSGTTWDTVGVNKVEVGDTFVLVTDPFVEADSLPYIVTVVTSDTVISLSANFAGATVAGEAYAISREFSTNYSWGVPITKDLLPAQILKKTIEDIDAKVFAVATAGGGTPDTISTLTDTTITAAAKGDLLAYNGTAWIDVTVGADGEVLIADSGDASGVSWTADTDTTDHTLLTNIGTNTHAQIDTHIALTNEHLDWAADQGATNLHVGNITEAGVTQHEAALTITESQISDLQSYLLNVSEDTTPQLGGDLDVNSNDIVSVSAGDITITPDTTGKTKITNLEADIPLNNQTGTTYTLVIGDSGKNVTMNNAAANTLTIPANASVAFPIGTAILITQFGAGQTSVTITTDTLSVNGTFTLNLAGRYSEALITKKTSTQWVISGDLDLV